MARVVSVWRYPVKSFQGEPVPGGRTAVGPSGVPGDRAWGVVDQATGKVLSAKREKRLLEGRARHDGTGGTVVVTLPDGPEFEAGDPKLDVALAEWLDRDVRLARAAEHPPTSYEMHVSAEDESSPLVEIPCPPGTFLDFAAVHLLTTSSLRAIAAHHPDGDWDVARFRPTVLVEHAGDGFVEDGWVGQRVRIGSVAIEPFMPTVRCAIPARPQPGLPRDLDIVKTINREHGASLGLYATVVEPGEVGVGDEVVAG